MQVSATIQAYKKENTQIYKKEHRYKLGYRNNGKQGGKGSREAASLVTVCHTRKRQISHNNVAWRHATLLFYIASKICCSDHNKSGSHISHYKRSGGVHFVLHHPKDGHVHAQTVKSGEPRGIANDPTPLLSALNIRFSLFLFFFSRHCAVFSVLYLVSFLLCLEPNAHRDSGEMVSRDLRLASFAQKKLCWGFVRLCAKTNQSISYDRWTLSYPLQAFSNSQKRFKHIHCKPRKEVSRHLMWGCFSYNTG